MARRTFSGGVHLYDGKDYSRDKQIQTLFPETGEMFFPLLQHFGKPAIPVVHPGDYVRTGQLMARADGDLSANLHSSVSGRVLRIEDRMTEDGGVIRGIVVQNDGVFLEVVYPSKRRLDQLTKLTVLDSIRQAGIVGLGGAGVPTHYKLLDTDERRITAVIANGVECEPYLTGSYQRILESPWKIINGMMILLTIFPRARGYIAVSENNEEGYRLMRDLLQDDTRIYVKKLKDKYPQGAEHQLIRALTGRSLSQRMLPGDIGCMVCNVDTLVAVNQAVIMSEPLITRILSVTGDAVAAPGNFRVRIGMSCLDLLEQAGGLADGLTLDDVLVLDGGPMMGRELEDLNEPVTKLTAGLVCLRRKRIRVFGQTPCTRCGRCLEACPSKLAPLYLYKDSIKSNKKAFLRHGGLGCSGCGCCSYICPSKIPLASEITGMQTQIINSREKAARRRER